ncbi:hypothetical protein D9V80_00330 [Buchnera aphidicola (Thelaxes californica)]|uniref:Flagellar assembly protein FliH n=1 Tax=Buchnera aphidicola (Thelaxes californica) TaxID=1315998 RepID=A0A4D6YA26_9GAMM|nr:FliH/SctL family protein [Buchnera aphidicola]QCI26617.1 hypothetical protein D9V80_00330 [Buchnera aphidicola (Thelaxes californica)]
MKDIYDNKWKQWCPEELNILNDCTNNSDCKKNNNIFILHKKKIDQIELNKNIFQEKKILKAMKKQFQEGLKEGEIIGFEKGKKAGIQNLVQLEQKKYSKIEKIFLNFQQSLDQLDSTFADFLLELSLVVFKEIIGITPISNRDFLLNTIKKVIFHEFTNALHKKIILHPKNKVLIEEKYNSLIKLYNWNIEYDMSIDVEGCKAVTNLGCKDKTLSSLWKELYRIAQFEE